MGFDRYHAIAATSYSHVDIDRAYAVAVCIFDEEGDLASYGCNMVTPILRSPANGWYTFFVGPDGGKEPGEPSKRGDARRAEFRSWLKSQAYDHGESRYAWVELYYCDDTLQTEIVDDGDAERRAAGDHLPHPSFGGKPEQPT